MELRYGAVGGSLGQYRGGADGSGVRIFMGVGRLHPLASYAASEVGGNDKEYYNFGYMR